MDTEELINKIVQCAMNVRLQLQPGYLESVYRNALMIELHDNGMKAETEVPIFVHYKGHIVGDFRADIIVEGSVIVELKSVASIQSCHETQLVNYLVATNIDNGLLINFGGEKLEVKRKFRVYRPKGK